MMELDEGAKPNHGAQGKGFFILHPRHHRGCGWLRIDSCTIKRGISGAIDHLSATR
jgi:hypothetical protein